ncbi:GntR family transcriptional regulator [Spirillospora sp. CA-255316]
MPVEQTRKLRTVSAVDAVAEALRDDVLAGWESVGPLTETGVAGRYDVARPTAKAAIERLVAEGILIRGASKTARVPRIGIDDIVDLYRLRTCLEVETLERIAVEGEVPEEAVEANNRIQALGPVSSPRLVSSDLAFHTSLVAATGSTRLERLYGSIMGEVRLSMAQVQAAHLLDAASIATEHAEILARVAQRDVSGAVHAIRVHLSRTEQALTHYLDQPEALRAPGGGSS